MITNFNNPITIQLAQNVYLPEMNAEICRQYCQKYDNGFIKFGTCCNFNINLDRGSTLKGICTLHAGTEVYLTAFSASLINIDGII